MALSFNFDEFDDEEDDDVEDELSDNKFLHQNPAHNDTGMAFCAIFYLYVHHACVIKFKFSM